MSSTSGYYGVDTNTRRGPLAEYSLDPAELGYTIARKSIFEILALRSDDTTEIVVEIREHLSCGDLLDLSEICRLPFILP